MGKAKILVVDDDEALAEMIGIVLRNDGFEPTFAADGTSALPAFCLLYTSDAADE